MGALTASRLLTITALAAALVWAVVLLRPHLLSRSDGLEASGPLDWLETASIDLRFAVAGTRAAPHDVLIVAVDDAAVSYAGSFPLPRQILARVIDKLFAGGARAVALDFQFLDPTTPPIDDALAKALRGGPTICAASAIFSSDPDTSPPAPGRVPVADGFVLPIEPFRSATALGLVNISTDASGNPRHVPMLIARTDALLPALSLRAVASSLGVEPSFTAEAVEVGGVETPLDTGRKLALRYYGPEGSIQTISAGQILTATLPTDFLRDRIVIIGSTATGAGDRFSTPFDQYLPGVEVHATAIANLHNGDALIRTSRVRAIDAGITMGLAVAVVLLLTMRHIGWGLAGVAALMVLFVGAACLSFAQGYWFSVAIPLAATVPVGVLTAAARLGLDRWTEKKLMRQEAALRAFHPPAIAKLLISDPDFLAIPVEREVAVLFIDLSGYTGMAERIGPQAARELLRQFHTLIEEEVLSGGGIVASYMGDGAMMVWGITAQGAEDAARAVRTALALRRRTLDWLASLPEGTRGKTGVKLSGHYGMAVVCRLGHAQHQHITAIGDSVNTASRLMEVAAEHGFRLALSQRLLETAWRQGLDPRSAQLTDPQDISIRGRAQALAICFLIES